MPRSTGYPGNVTAHIVDDIDSEPERLVALEAVHNFRDLGGYATADGRTTCGELCIVPTGSTG